MRRFTNPVRCVRCANRATTRVAPTVLAAVGATLVVAPLCGRPLCQGNRISKLSDKLGQVFVIPACELELSTQGRLGVVLSHDIESHVAQDGEIVGSIVEAISGLILVHNDVEAPMEPIFD